MAETILVELILNDNGTVDSTIDDLVKLGKIDKEVAETFKRMTAEFNKGLQLFKTGGANVKDLKKNFEALIGAVKKLPPEMSEAFQEEFLTVLQEAGISVDEFMKSFESDIPVEATQSIRTELRKLTEEITAAQIAGKDYGAGYEQLVKRATKLRDAVGNVSTEIRNLASNTSTIDGMIGVVSGLAGAFAVTQGTAALFGEENEELQKTLLKVNAAMAILQGLQTVQQTLHKSSAASLLVLNTRQAVYNAQKTLETGLESKNIVVKYASAVAQTVLNAAMAANPIGLVVIALTGLIALLAKYGASAAEAARQSNNLKVALETGAANFGARIEAINKQNATIIEGMKNEGRVDSEIKAQELENAKQVAEARKQRIAELNAVIKSNNEAELDQRTKAIEELRQLDADATADRIDITNKEYEIKKQLYAEDLRARIATIEAALPAAVEGSKKQLDLQKQLIIAQMNQQLAADGLLAEEQEAIRAKAHQQIRELDAAATQRAMAAQIKEIENRLINIKAGSQEELNLKKQIIQEQVDLDIAGTKLSEQEKQNIIEKGIQDQLKLEKEYQHLFTKLDFEAQIDRNNAELGLVEIGDERKLQLKIENINYAAGIEIDAAEDNAAKIEAINAKAEADIVALKKAAIDEAVDYELRMTAANTGAERRALQRVIANERTRLSVRIDAINRLADYETDAIDTQLDALDDQLEQDLISRKEYNLKVKELLDQRNAITEGANEDEAKARKEHFLKIAGFIMQTADMMLQTISMVNDIATQREENRIEGMRRALEDAKEAGAITEKEALAREKRIEAEERKAKVNQARRDKNLATFQALLAVPKAILQGLAQGGPILAAIYGALAAVQLGLIISRPLPKLFKGKRKEETFGGFAEVGEIEPELIHRNGKQLEYIPQKTITWIGSRDIVYTPAQTKKILHHVDKQVMRTVINKDGKLEIDYDKLGTVIGKKIKNVTVNVDRDGISVEDGINKLNYFNQRYTFKK